jgi:DNA-binding MarR family transcriptional regulator
MHAILFSLKRAQHRSLTFCRKILAGCGITPARFDMLYAVMVNRDLGLLQSELRRALGVTAATVSRMAASLEKLGFIRRTRDTFDRRQVLVEMTDEGKVAFRCARRVAIRTGAVDALLTRAIVISKTTDEAFADLLQFSDALEHVRRSLDDTAELFYPFHPDD